MSTSGPIATVKSRLIQGTSVERVDDAGRVVLPRGAKRLVVALNQVLTERGLRAPWMASRDACQQFWSTRSDDSNAPATYAEKDTGVIDFLHAFWGPEVSADDRVLELGCNSGANLERLRQLGFSALEGIEINPHALEHLRSEWPGLAEQATLRSGPIEDRLAELPDGAVDVVFTMAVLIHVHPTSKAVLGEMARVAGRYVCVIELETAANPYVFSRNYGRVFERLGSQLVRSTRITAETHPEVARDYDGYVARLFRVPGAASQNA